MRILFVTKSRRETGSYWRVWFLAKFVSTLGMRARIVCPGAPGTLRPRIIRVSESLSETNLPRISSRTRLLGMVYRTALGPIVWNLHDADVVHVCAPGFPETWSVVAAAKALGKPVVVDIDDWWGMDTNQPRSLLEGAFEELLERTAVSMSRYLIAVGDEILDRRNRENRKPSRKVGNGIDPTEFAEASFKTARSTLEQRWSIPRDTTRIVAQYDPRFLVVFERVVRKLASLGSRTKLLLYGCPAPARTNGPPILDMDGHSRIELPPLSRTEYLTVICSADALLLPMDDIPFDRARFPIKLAEYLATGRPIVSNSVGVTRRVLAAAGYPTEKRSDLTRTGQGLDEAVEYFLRGNEDWEEIADRAREYALSHLTWLEAAKACAQIYVEITSDETSTSLLA